MPRSAGKGKMRCEEEELHVGLSEIEVFEERGVVERTCADCATRVVDIYARDR